MIDPIHSLAFALQSNRGIYAVLLGSGVSRSAGISNRLGDYARLDSKKMQFLHGDTIASEPESLVSGEIRKGTPTIPSFLITSQKQRLSDNNYCVPIWSRMNRSVKRD